MQDVENNMDDLLRRAADNYGLKPGESNWDNIVSQLQGETVHNIAPEKINDLKKYAIAAVLAFVFLVTGDIYNSQQRAYKFETVLVNKLKPGQQIISNSKEINTDHKTMLDVNASKEPTAYTVSKNKQQQVQYLSLNNDNTLIHTGLTKSENKTTVKQLYKTGQSVNKNIIETGVEPKKVNENNITKKKIITSDNIETPVAADETNTKTNTINPQKNTSKKQPGLYFGVVAGPAFNAVKYQELRKPGFDIGIIAGYDLNNKMSVETGLLFAKKNYFSDGKYFSMNKVGATMPAGMNVLSLEGSTGMLEIPLKVKYNIATKYKSNIFSSAGITSYVLISEKNNYLTQLNGTKQNIISSYKNSSGYFAAAVNLSLGYEYKTGKNNSIRIEPYMQIPLKGIGVGALPVMSAGVHIGFTFSPH